MHSSNKSNHAINNTGNLSSAEALEMCAVVVAKLSGSDAVRSFAEPAWNALM